MNEILPDEMLFDVRLQDRFLRSGRLNKEKIQQKLEKIDDCSENMDVINLEQLAPRTYRPSV